MIAFCSRRRRRKCTLFTICIVFLIELLQFSAAAAAASSSSSFSSRHQVSTGRRLLWSEQWITDRLAELDNDVELYDYEPQLIVNESDSRLLSDVREPLRWTLDGLTHRFRPSCRSTSVAQHNAFELAWSEYVKLHHGIASGVLEPRFVHVGFPPEAGLHARLKVLTSATLLAFALRRALVVSWVPTPRESGMLHSSLVELFRSPGFDWWYTTQKYSAPRFRRLTSVVGFGQEDDATLTYEPSALLCDDLRLSNISWMELHWKYDAFAAAVYHNPFLKPTLQRYLAPDDLYGPIARKLFFPHKRLWKKVQQIYFNELRTPVTTPTTHDDRDIESSLLVVGLELGKATEWRSLRECVETRGWRPLIRRPRGKRALARLQSSFEQNTIRLFVVAANQLLRATVVNEFTANHTYFYKSHATASDSSKFDSAYPTDEREIIDEFLFQLSAVVIVPERTDRNRHMFFSQQAIIHSSNDNVLECIQEQQCQPCLPWNSIGNMTCANQIDDKQLQQQQRVCMHSLWYRW